MFSCLIVALGLSIIIMLLSLMLASKVGVDSEKGSSYECGFDPLSFSRVPFSLQFFLVGIIFLIFDVEICLMLVFPLCSFFSGKVLFVFVGFVFILLCGLYYEWGEGSLEWLYS